MGICNITDLRQQRVDLVAQPNVFFLLPLQLFQQLSSRLLLQLVIFPLRRNPMQNIDCLIKIFLQPPVLIFLNTESLLPGSCCPPCSDSGYQTHQTPKSVPLEETTKIKKKNKKNYYCSLTAIFGIRYTPIVYS